MHLEPIEDRDAIERLLRRDAGLHLYEIGDLDDFFFPETTYYALRIDGEIAKLGLVYAGGDPPVLIVMGRDADAANVRALLRTLRDRLPARVYAHLAPGTSDALGDAFVVEPRGLHDRMLLVDRSRTDAVDTREACALGRGDRREIEELFARAYPGNWFAPRMLETGTYFGVRRDGTLVAVAGVHVVSRALGVAGLGNITTDPAHRGKGLARVATAAVCEALAAEVDPLHERSGTPRELLIGLNVESTNRAAIALYRRLGFERVASYEEAMVTRRGG